MKNIKNKLKKTIVYTIYLKFKYIVYPIKLKIYKVNKRKPNKISIEENSQRNIIVSLTSFPGRIDIVHKTIYSIMNQSIKPNKIILWLSKKQFPKLEETLPKELLDLREYGLTIEWTEDDLRSYKKLIPTLKIYSDSIIITADDDIYYPVDWLSNLYESYLKYPKDIQCHIITRLKQINKKLVIDNKDKRMIGKASYYNKLLGAGGVLYPPNSLNCNIFNEKEFLELAPTSDDIWFWAMALLNNTKIRWIRKNMRILCYTEYSQESTECLCKINDEGEKLFFKHLDNLVNKYNILEILEKDGRTDEY